METQVQSVHLLSQPVVFLEVRTVADLPIATATGWILPSDSRTTAFLVTNRHVATGLAQGSSTMLWNYIPGKLIVRCYSEWPGSQILYTSFEVNLYADEQQLLHRWVEHPNHGQMVDVVAIPIDTRSLNCNIVAGNLAKPAGSKDILVGPGDRVTVIGYPMGSREQSPLPLWVTGFVASQLDEEPLRFMIDCRTRQGQSGSPVFAYRLQGEYASLPDGTLRQLRVRDVRNPSIHGYGDARFLGIYSGRMHKEADLGYVWKPSVVTEVVVHAAAAEAVVPRVL